MIPRFRSLAVGLAAFALTALALAAHPAPFLA